MCYCRVDIHGRLGRASDDARAKTTQLIDSISRGLLVYFIGRVVMCFAESSFIRASSGSSESSGCALPTPLQMTKGASQATVTWKEI